MTQANNADGPAEGGRDYVGDLHLLRYADLFGALTAEG
jgi:hypothetical protein